MIDLQSDWMRLHIQYLLDSFEKFVGYPLLDPRPSSPAEAIFRAPFVVVSHGTQSSPILNYGNQIALDLWELSWDQFTQTPSYKTAEAVHRDTRAKMLADVTQHQFIANYTGVRIAQSGKRFMIEDGIIWNVLGRDGEHYGQAATFKKWSFLPQ